MRISPKTKKFLIFLGATGGFIVLSILAPQLPYVLLRAYLKGRKFQSWRFKQDLNRLTNQKLISWREIDDKIEIKVTRDGKKKTLQFQFEETEIEKPKVWDKKWRVVIFDIPEKKKLARNVLRDKLKQLGFLRLQKSVFIYPYDCKEIISFFRQVYQVHPYVQYFIAESFENEDYLKRYFNL